MREERKRKALYVNRREDLYNEVLLQKERAPGKTPRRRQRRPVDRGGAGRRGAALAGPELGLGLPSAPSEGKVGSSRGSGPTRPCR